MIVFFLLFVLPHVVVLSLPLAFETPKVIVAQFAIGILFVVWIFSGNKSKDRWFKTPQIWLIGILLILSIAHTLNSASAISVFGNVFRLQGVILFCYLLLFSFMARDFEPRKIPSILYFLSLLGLYGSVFFYGQSGPGRMVGSLGEANALGATAVFLLPFIFFSKQFIPRAVSVGVVSILIFLSQSKSALLAFFLLWLFSLMVHKTKIPLVIAYGIVLIVLITSFLYPFVSRISGYEKTYLAYENRGDIWQTAFAAGLESPIIGHGFIIQEVLHETSKKLPNNFIQYQVVDSSHNFLLDYWVQTGAVGVASILGLIGLTIRSLLIRKDTLGLSCLLIVLAVMSFNPVSIVTLLSFWWLIGRGA